MFPYAGVFALTLDREVPALIGYPGRRCVDAALGSRACVGENVATSSLGLRHSTKFADF